MSRLIANNQLSSSFVAPSNVISSSNDPHLPQHYCKYKKLITQYYLLEGKINYTLTHVKVKDV
ncbi:hypothetical protein Mgra_00001001 [Meloidogyne graminicola]|uniref:Uncharacterized protein n=1 Tax=Meloidogyne graminicola TaxID=189291 RepID=A0A8T0A2N6_9BILA|nr:hypothetical protein Mgra_00001001 [Meloidogyne graminicola]